MKFLQQLFMVVFLLFTLVGCGGKGGGDYNGDLTIKTSQSDNGNGTSNLSFTIQYEKTGVTNYAGLYCSVNNGSSDSFTFSSSGIHVITYYDIPTGSSVSLKAQVGDIVSSASITAKANTTLTVSPDSYAFGTGGTGTSASSFTISGGSAPYSLVSSTGDITPSPLIGDTTFTVAVTNQNTTTTAKTATITITDSSSPVNTATLTVTY